MDIKDRTILITGGAGFIGSHLAERLAEHNRIRIVDDFSTGTHENLNALRGRNDVEVIEGDVADADALKSWCQDVDIVFHLAVSCLRTSLNDPLESHDVNAGGTLKLCLAALDRGVERFVYVSSSEVYGTARQAPMTETHPTEPLTVYGSAKLAGEFYVKACHRTYGLPVVIVRPFNTYGPREPWRGRRAEVIPRFILRALGGAPPVVFGDGTQTRDFTFVDDTVTGIIQAAGCDALVGDVINIAAGKEVAITRLACLIGEQMGLHGRPELAAARPGDVTRHWADISKAKKLLGFSPRITLDDGLPRCIEWFRQNASCANESLTVAGSPNW